MYLCVLRDSGWLSSMRLLGDVWQRCQTLRSASRRLSESWVLLRRFEEFRVFPYFGQALEVVQAFPGFWQHSIHMGESLNKRHVPQHEHRTLETLEV